MLNNKYVELTNVLRKLIQKYSNNTKVKNIILSEFEERNILASKAVRILTGKIKLEELSIDDENDLFLLFAFTFSMQKALSTIDEFSEKTLGELEEYSSLVLENYFTVRETIGFKDFKFEKKEVSKYPYVLHNMIQVEERHWTGIISAQLLAGMNAANDIIYNFNTQRDPKINVFGFKGINLDKDKIQKITQRLKEGKQRPDEIKLNVLRGTGDDIEVEFRPYQKNGIVGDLIIHSGEINIFDGYHRKTSNSIVAKEIPDINYNWKLGITNWSEKDAQDFMLQVNEQKQISKEHVKNIEDTLGNLVVDNIRDDRNSELGLQIKNSDEELKHSGLTKKSILSMSINECYQDRLQNRIQAKAISDWLVDFFNYLMGLYVDEFIINVKETRKHSIINHKNMFYAYISLSAQLYNNDNWKQILKDSMGRVNFKTDPENPLYKEILLSEENLSKTVKKNLYNTFGKDGVS